MSEEGTSLDHEAVRAMLPHRAPMLLVDRVESLVPGERCVAIKVVSANEPWFAGHFPGNPIMPGVLVLECMAQAAGIVAVSAHPGIEGQELYLLKADAVRWRRMVRPGDTLRIEVVVLRKRRKRIWSFGCRAFVGDELAGEAELMAMTAVEDGG